ncbi:MAG: hypothetical protein FK732_05170, partial [Asgard group archaeon]|nr:hypothetical protein [Asgard group archaeon]
MLKKKTMLILFVSLLLTQIFVLQPNINAAIMSNKPFSTIESEKQPLINNLTPNAPPGTDNVKYNIIDNGQFESEQSDGSPANFKSYGTGFSNVSFTYQDEVHAGTYGAYFLTKGTSQNDAYVYGSRSVGSYQDTALDEDLALDFWFNAKAVPDISTYTEMRLSMYFTNNWVDYYYLYYYLKATYVSPNNATNQAVYDIRTATVDTWVHITRNVTDDLIQGATSLPDASLMCLYSYELYCYSSMSPTGNTIMLVDDNSLTNGSAYDYFSDNGDFEDGDEIPWYKSAYGPSFITLTQSDKTQGNSAVNITASCHEAYSYSYTELYRNLFSYYGSVPKGYIAYQPGDIVCE